MHQNEVALSAFANTWLLIFTTVFQRTLLVIFGHNWRNRQATNFTHLPDFAQMESAAP
jgi:hypothetical protein